MTNLPAVIILFFGTRKKRMITAGKLVIHGEVENESTLVITEKVRFRNSVECISNYNRLVFEWSESALDYDIESWTYNTFNEVNQRMELFRFGNCIEVRRTILKKVG